jgi:hypothetical protein
VVKNGIKEVEKIQNAVEQFKKLAGFCQKSTLYYERLKSEREDLNRSCTTPVNYTRIIQPMETQWNSLLMMRQSVIHLRPTLEGIKESSERSTDTYLMVLVIDSDQFDLIGSITQVLSKFEEV